MWGTSFNPYAFSKKQRELLQNIAHINNTNADNKEKHIQASNGQVRSTQSTAEASKREKYSQVQKEYQHKKYLNDQGGLSMSLIS